MSRNDAPAPETAEQAAKPQPESDAAQTMVRWDGAKMRTTYANVCNVSSSREEVTMLFGTNQTWHAGQKELTVELSDRMILNPYTAKRLALLLSRTIAEYEKRFGELTVENAG